MARLDTLASMLKADDSLTVKVLANRLSVSQRTLQRDINLLRERGLPIETDRGRGGGVRLHRQWGVGRLNITEQEAVDLLLSVAIAEKMESPLFMTSLESIRHKLMASLSTNQKHKIKSLRQRVRIGSSGSYFVLSSYTLPCEKAVQQLNRAFLFKQKLAISYANVDSEPSQRIIEPHYLYLHYPVWYIFAWDELRNDYRTFRCDRIQQATTQPDSFTLRAFEEFPLMTTNEQPVTP